MKKHWESDLLDHLVFLVLCNAESPRAEDEVRDDLKRKLGSLLSDEAISARGGSWAVHPAGEG